MKSYIKMLNIFRLKKKAILDNFNKQKPQALDDPIKTAGTELPGNIFVDGDYI